MKDGENMTELNTNDLMIINGGGKIGEFLGDLGSATAKGLEGAVKGYTSLVHTCYDAGKQLGRYIRNW